MKRKQIVVLGLVLVIISIGILQYNYNTSGESSNPDIDTLVMEQDNDLEDIPGAAVYVEGSDVTDEDLEKVQQTGGFFAEMRMERDKARSKQKEELASIAKASADGTVAASTTITSLQAQEQLLDLIRRSEAEATIETLVKQIGFEDALAYMSETRNVDVLVKADSLSAQEVAQISDIVVRHADVTMDKITVKNLN
ncbi:MAG TPA: SpoIIIAH-like family protein [Clostridiaceae bacterium]|nr:SpoIIIAH-like family protein [Clostridiaceae bacterium]